MVQRCWNKGPLGPSIGWGSFVLYYFNDPNDKNVKYLKEKFKSAKIVKVEDVKTDPDSKEVPFKYALVWSW
ncbi:hypothetical protein IPA_03015 [Ignicoccus pacificus DSM 13166]|uniref:Uncharacterized protein n=1 Tax=Ignicoccus pacificus DSM 13166 TaxID=940294 RepID=A0A977PKQ4_9CREN|nr:hypothetical protein IPA_03015 [Ignicoccus pacificus DSM 13166]